LDILPNKADIGRVFTAFPSILPPPPSPLWLLFPLLLLAGFFAWWNRRKDPIRRQRKVLHDEIARLRAAMQATKNRGELLGLALLFLRITARDQVQDSSDADETTILAMRKLDDTTASELKKLFDEHSKAAYAGENLAELNQQDHAHIISIVEKYHRAEKRC
jgi:hypothetical protein